MKKVFSRRMALLLCMIMVLSAVLVPSYGYIRRGDVQISGADSCNLAVNGSTELKVTPWEEMHLPGCGMAECPAICGEKDCIVMINGQPECKCAGEEMEMYHALVQVSSSDPSVAEVSYGDNGIVTITGKSVGSAEVTVNAAFREYNPAARTVKVNVKTEEEIRAETPAVAESFTIRTFNDSRAEDDQNIEVAITFDREIKVSGGAEEDVLVKIAGSPLDQSPSTEDGKPNRTLRVQASGTDPKTLLVTIGCVPGSKFVKQTNASITVQAAEAVTHILTADNNKPVDLKYIDTVIPCGLELSTVSQTNSGSQAAVTKQVTHRANVRSMVYIQPLLNGKPILPLEKFDHEGSYVIHAHAFIPTLSGETVLAELTEADYAKLIYNGFQSSVSSLADIKARFTMTMNGDQIILTDTQAEEGETLDVIIYAWPVCGGEVQEVPSDSGNNGDSAVFTDVGGWYQEYVYYLVNRGIINGRTPTTFAPDENITRAEFAKILSVAAGAEISTSNVQSPFSDVPSDKWYAPYVAWAKEHQIVNGIGGNQFGPDRNITRQDMAVMIQRYSVQTGHDLPDMEAPVTFLDEQMIGDYAKTAVSAMQRASIIGGYPNGNFYPQGTATRAQAAKMIAVFLQVTGA